MLLLLHPWALPPCPISNPHRWRKSLPWPGQWAQKLPKPFFFFFFFFFQHRNSDFISWRDLHVTVSILQQNLPRDPGWRDFANDSQPSGSPAKVKIPVAQVSHLTLSSQKELRWSLNFSILLLVTQGCAFFQEAPKVSNFAFLSPFASTFSSMGRTSDRKWGEGPYPRGHGLRLEAIIIKEPCFEPLQRGRSIESHQFWRNRLSHWFSGHPPCPPWTPNLMALHQWQCLLHHFN